MRNSLILVGFAALLSFGCDKAEEDYDDLGQPDPNRKVAKLAPPDEAVKIYSTRCAACHGDKGGGDGAGAGALKVKPANFTSKEWQASLDDQAIKDTIVKGGAAMGKDPGMAANPDLGKKPEVLDELVKILRGYGK